MKRTISVSSRGTRLSLHNSRVTVQREDAVLAEIPIEDLGLVIVETTGVSISSGVMSALGEAGGALLACDDTHHPCGMYMPLDANSLYSERVRLQAAMSAPLKKNLWARIIRAKITNQAAILGPELGRPLVRLADTTRSGDSTAHEGQASRIYWPLVFASCPMVTDHPFRRRRDGKPPNNLLNYCYAILRAATARALCTAGLQPVIGVHHQNRYSGFCLADDVMEPYRPIADELVREVVRGGSLAIDKLAKNALIGIVMRPVLMDGERTSLWVALERTASSLAKAIEMQVKGGMAAPEAARLLVLPEVAPPCH